MVGVAKTLGFGTTLPSQARLSLLTRDQRAPPSSLMVDVAKTLGFGIIDESQRCPHRHASPSSQETRERHHSSLLVDVVKPLASISLSSQDVAFTGTPLPRHKLGSCEGTALYLPKLTRDQRGAAILTEAGRREAFGFSTIVESRRGLHRHASPSSQETREAPPSLLLAHVEKTFGSSIIVESRRCPHGHTSPSSQETREVPPSSPRLGVVETIGCFPTMPLHDGFVEVPVTSRDQAGGSEARAKGPRAGPAE